MNIFTKQKQTHRYRKQIYGYQIEWGEINYKLEINIYTFLYIKQVNNKDLQYTTGNYIRFLVIIYKESEKEYI